MTRNWLLALLAGLLIGAAVGFAFSTQFSRGAPKASAFLREFSFPAFAAQAGQADWKIIEDRIYDLFPSLARQKRIARRVIAHATMTDMEQGRVAGQLQNAVRAALHSHSAIVKDQFDANQSLARVTNSSIVQAFFDLPRRYYTSGDIHGVADVWCVADSGRVTVMISIIEGP